MRLRTVTGIVLLLALSLTACATLPNPFRPLSAQRQEAVDRFIYTLRWQLYPEAAAHFVSEHRQTFLDRSERFRKALTVTDVRLQRLDVADDGRRARVRLEMDYYLLPSVTLTTLRIDQTWVYFETDTEGRKGFLITTPFPAIPGE